MEQHIIEMPIKTRSAKTMTTILLGSGKGSDNMNGINIALGEEAEVKPFLLNQTKCTNHFAMIV